MRILSCNRACARSNRSWKRWLPARGADGDNVDDLLSRLKPALADRYVVESEIGRGGMATVYLARDLRHNRSVAIKVLDPALSERMGRDAFPAGIGHQRTRALASAATRPFVVSPAIRAFTSNNWSRNRAAASKSSAVAASRICASSILMSSSGSAS